MEKSNKTPSLLRERLRVGATAGMGWGGSPDTLMTPLTPSETGCRPCVYRGFSTLTPLNRKIRAARAREATMR